MKRFLLSTTCVLGAAAPLLGQDAEALENPNRFNFGPRIGFNFKAQFRDGSRSNPGPAIGGVNHEYDDGHVRVDISGNPASTWNWGYQNASQVTGGGIAFHSEQLATVPLEVETGSDDIQYGGELTYQRVVGTFFLSGRWGFEGAISYTDLELEEQRSATGTTTHLVDTYPFLGTVPPTAPYNGSFNGPGPLLSGVPTRIAPTEGASTITQQQLQGHAVGFRVGPFFEWNFTKRFGAALSAGLAFAETRIRYEFSEATQLQSGSTVTSRGSSSKGDLLYGNYVAGLVRYDFSDHWGVYAGAQFQQLNDLEQTASGRTARLEQDATLYGVAGVSWRF